MAESTVSEQPTDQHKLHVTHVNIQVKKSATDDRIVMCPAPHMIGHSYVYMHNGHRDRTECVNERDRVVRYRGEAWRNRR